MNERHLRPPFSHQRTSQLRHQQRRRPTGQPDRPKLQHAGAVTVPEAPRAGLVEAAGALTSAPGPKVSPTGQRQPRRVRRGLGSVEGRRP